MSQRKSKEPRPCRPKLVRVHMSTTAPRLDHNYEAVRTYDLPREVAERLIARGAAVVVEKEPSVAELAAAEPKYPGPWSDDDWCSGISPNDWAEWRDPQAWEICEEWDLYSEGVRQLCAHLRADIDAGEIALGIPGSPTKPPKLVNQHALPQIITAIPFMAFGPDPLAPEPVIVDFGKEQYEVRIYRPDHLGRGQIVGPSATEGHAEQETKSSRSAKERIKEVAERMVSEGQVPSGRAVWEALGAPSRNPTLDYVSKQLRFMGYR